MNRYGVAPQAPWLCGRVYAVLAIIMAMTVLCFNAPAYAACTNPAGQEGETVYNNAYSVLQYCDNTNWIAMTGGSAGGYVPNAVTFDGSTTYLTYLNPLTGVTDGTKVTASFWYRMNTYPSSSCHRIIGTNPGRFDISYCGNGTETMQIVVRDTGGAIAGSVGCGPNPHVVGVWYHHLISLDVATGAANCYVDDADSKQTFTAPVNTTLDFTLSQFAVGGSTAGSLLTDGDIADLWVDFNTYLDFSNVANRRKFIDGSGNPVFLGADGAFPTGTAPDIFLSGDTSIWHTNKGTGGGFTENGVLTTATTRLVSSSSVSTSSMVGYWKMNETSGSTVTDSSGNGNNGTWTDATDNAITIEAVAGQTGGALDFEQTDSSEINVSPNASINNMSQISVCAWIKPESAGDGGTYPNIMSKADNADNGWNFYYNSVSLDLGFYTNEYAYVEANTTNISVGSWQHVCGTWDGTDGTAGISVYMNGSEMTSYGTTGDSSASTADDSAVDLTIGYHLDNQQHFDGVIDDVCLFDKELTSTEVADIYNNGCPSTGACTAAEEGNVRYNYAEHVPEFCNGTNWVSMAPTWPVPSDSSLVLHWKLDEDSGATIVDSSGNGRNGTWTDGDDDLITTESNTAIIGNGLSFSSGSGLVSVNDNVIAAAAAANGVTTSAWVKLNSGAPSGRVLERQWDNLDIHYNNGSDRYNCLLRDVSTGFYYAYSNTPTKDVWAHIACVYDPVANELRLYYNGALQDTTDATAFSQFQDNSVSVGVGQRPSGGNVFDGSIDDVRIYNRALSVAEVKKLANSGPATGTNTALPSGCATIGDVCDDGTVYAGLSPDGNVAMFTTPQDAGELEWNDGNTNYTTTGATSAITGAANTLTLIRRDSDSVSAGKQKHNAAQYCHDLVSHGADDWYLPAQNELNVLYTNRVAIGNFELSGGEYGPPKPSWYWSSTESSAADIILQRFEDGTTAGWNKFYPKSVRCVRKGPAPRCSSPTGVEGQMIYNQSGNVLQYCDGTRWVAIGKLDQN